MYVDKNNKKKQESYVPLNVILRTRITTKLKDEIDKNAGMNGQSVADYVRAVLSASSGDIRSVLNNNKILLDNLNNKITRMAVSQELIIQKLSIKNEKKPKFKHKVSSEDLPEVSYEEVQHIIATTPDSF